MAKFKNLITETGSFLFEELNRDFKNPFETDDKNLIAHLEARSDWELIKEEKSLEEIAAEEAAKKAEAEKEFAALKGEAISLNIKFADNISFKKLKKLVEESKDVL